MSVAIEVARRAARPAIGPWSPLRNPVFRMMWFAALLSNVGTWMHEVAEAWLMTTTTPSPLLVALLKTASSAPLFLLALPAGALGDIVDRRKLLLVTQTWMLLVATGLGVSTLLGWSTPGMLLAFAFAIGVGAAVNAPVWQAIAPELVTTEELPAAIALSGIAINVARAVGPAVGGMLLSVADPAVVFLLNAASFVVVVVALLRWKRSVLASEVPAESLLGAIRAGARYVRHAPELRVVLWRAALFIVPGSAVWALFPFVGRHELGLGSLGFGLLMAALGAGAVLTAAVLPKIRQRLSSDASIFLGTIVFGGAALALAFVRVVPVAYLASFVAGGGWITIMSSLNVAAQRSAPAWVRARALAVFTIVSQGGLAIGAVAWGSVAVRFDVTIALTLAAGAMLAGAFVGLRYRLSAQDETASAPSRHWPRPVLVSPREPGEGPVLVTLEYEVAEERTQLFLESIRELARIRRRDGARQWGVYRDAAEPTRFVEAFSVESWAEHQRQHERLTVADRVVEERTRSAVIAGSSVRVRHLVHARTPNTKVREARAPASP